MLSIWKFKPHCSEVFSKAKCVAINYWAIEEIDRELEHDKKI